MKNIAVLQWWFVNDFFSQWLEDQNVSYNYAHLEINSQCGKVESLQFKEVQEQLYNINTLNAFICLEWDREKG